MGVVTYEHLVMSDWFIAANVVYCKQDEVNCKGDKSILSAVVHG